MCANAILRSIDYIYIILTLFNDLMLNKPNQISQNQQQSNQNLYTSVYVHMTTQANVKQLCTDEFDL